MNIASCLLAIGLVAFAPVGVSGPAFADARGCPPGLAKKHPPCVPPGHAKKGGKHGEWRDHDRRGDIVDRDDFFYLDDFSRYDLPPLPRGQRYGVVDDQIVVIDPQSYQILQLIRAFTDLTN